MISAFIASYGYLAVLGGTLLEGETVLLGTLEKIILACILVAGLSFWLCRQFFTRKVPLRASCLRGNAT